MTSYLRHIAHQDSAPAHHARETIELLSRDTPDFIGPEMWPPNSPDLNPVDYSIWSVVEQRVYQERIHNTDELWQRLLTVWNELEQQIIDNAVDQWKIVWQPVCEKRVGILSTHSKNSSLGLVLLSVDGIEH